MEAVLGVHEKFSALIADVFNSDKLMISALDRACSVAVNFKSNPRQHSKSPEIVSNQMILNHIQLLLI